MLGVHQPRKSFLSVALHCPGRGGEQAKDTEWILSTAEPYLDCSLWGLATEGVI